MVNKINQQFDVVVPRCSIGANNRLPVRLMWNKPSEILEEFEQIYVVCPFVSVEA
jgi:hypothetical protein